MFYGSIVALITPFTEAGNIDAQAFGDLIRWHVANGTDALIIGGSTGEGLSLAMEEKLALFSLAVSSSGGNIPIIASTGTNVTRESVLLTQKAKEVGVDGCMAIVPYYNKPTFAGCKAHFTEIAHCGLPTILYHHPGRTGRAYSAEELAEFAAIDGVVGIKEASGDLLLATSLRAKTTTPLFSGDDSLALAYLGVGFDGTISVVGNALPGKWKEFIGSRKRALFYEMLPLCQALVKETNPQPIKAAVSFLGKCGPFYRLPLIAPQQELLEELSTLLDQLSDEPRPARLVTSS